MNSDQETSESRVSKGGNRSGAGRKAIGITRKLSLTLTEKDWAEIDRRCDRGDYSVSEIIRSIIEDHLREVDSL
ncbi:ribbon-helix-helix protein, CopG family [Cohnella herbarum]|nr:ribbon-helix-helix protein, CopG family [Cohnella herbarum]